MSVFRFVPIDKVHRRADARPLDDGAVAALADSIATIGLRSPILVRLRHDGDYELIAGSHRLAACDALDIREIEAIEVTDDDLTAELAMIDENLVRCELAPGDRAKQTARRKDIYEALHPETRNGENQHSRVRQLGEGSAAARFTADTAAKTGQSERSVQRDAERGAKVIDEVVELLRGTTLNTGAYLDNIKDLPPNDQVAAARRDLAFARKQEREQATRAKTSKKPKLASSPGNKISETAGLAHAELLALLDRLVALHAPDIIAACPTRERAALCSRLSPLIDLFQAVMDEVAS